MFSGESSVSLLTMRSPTYFVPTEVGEKSSVSVVELPAAMTNGVGVPDLELARVPTEG